MKDRLEAWLVGALFWLLARLGPATASDIGGLVARTIGPLLPVSRVADGNLRLAMPELDRAARRRIVRGVWDNLGRTAAEFPHVKHLRLTAAGPGFEVAGQDVLDGLLAAGGPVVFVAGHFANWEIAFALFRHYRRHAAPFYRKASNPLVDRIIVAARALEGLPQFAKGAAGARGAMLHLRDGGMLSALADQKMNDGIAATLFGHTAMTASAPAALALRFGCPLVPVRFVRLGPARVRVVFEPPLAVPASGDRNADVAALTQAVNDRIEAWARACPDQWLWLHRRWPKEIMP
jgi:KDO2-lipid IV(A) lauroyltransferase